MRGTSAGWHLTPAPQQSALSVRRSTQTLPGHPVVLPPVSTCFQGGTRSILHCCACLAALQSGSQKLPAFTMTKRAICCCHDSQVDRPLPVSAFQLADATSRQLSLDPAISQAGLQLQDTLACCRQQQAASARGAGLGTVGLDRQRLRHPGHAGSLSLGETWKRLFLKTLGSLCCMSCLASCEVAPGCLACRT